MLNTLGSDSVPRLLENENSSIGIRTENRVDYYFRVAGMPKLTFQFQAKCNPH